MDITISLITTLVLTLINGYFSMSEMALTTAKRAVLEHEAEEGDKRAERAIKLAADSDQLLATIQVAITLVGFASSAVASTSLSDPLATWLMSFGIAPLSAIARGLAPVIITVAVAFVSIVIGELVPKRIGLANAEGVSKQVVGPLSVFQKIARPLVWLTGACSDGLARILRIKSADDRQNVSEEEIKYMVSEQDDLLDEEKRMIHEIFDLGDTVAREVMVPRVDTTMCEDDETVADVLSAMRQTGFSRIPVYHEDPDNVAGIAHIKDLIQPSLDGKGDQPIADFLRDATFVPDTKDILPLLSEMQTSHDQIVVVVDEYGGTAGIITIEDSAELRFLEHPHVVRLEARPRNAEGTGEVTIRDLVINALRMRPDRIVVGECRGAEALDMLQAMNTGHDGSLTTLHAGTEQETVVRLTLLARYGIDLPSELNRGADCHGARRHRDVRASCGRQAFRVLLIRGVRRGASGGVELERYVTFDAATRTWTLDREPPFIAEGLRSGTLTQEEVDEWRSLCPSS